jgi:hypothetical protein
LLSIYTVHLATSFWYTASRKEGVMLRIVKTAVADVIKAPLRPGLIKLQRVLGKKFVSKQGRTPGRELEDGIRIPWRDAA